MGWSTQQVENAFGMEYASVYEDVKKRGVVITDNGSSLSAFQSMEHGEVLTYWFNVSTAESKTKIEYQFNFFETPNTEGDTEIAILMYAIVVDLSYDDTEVKTELARLEREKTDKPFIFSFEKLGTPIYEKDEDSSSTSAYTKEQVEAAFGMSTAEIYEELKTRDAIIDSGMKLLPCTRLDANMDGVISFCYYCPTFGIGLADYTLSFYVEPTEMYGGVMVSLLVQGVQVNYTDEIFQINKAIEDNEEVIASALNELNDSKENISAKVQIISSESTTYEYPSAKAVYD
jgi:hypothetical protein